MQHLSGKDHKKIGQDSLGIYRKGTEDTGGQSRENILNPIDEVRYHGEYYP